MKKIAIMAAAVLAVMFVVGCQSGTSVVAVTSSTVGIQATVWDQTTPPKVVIAYNREECAIVPTNRDKTWAKDSYKDGALDTADVLMMLDIANIFDFTSTLIRSRLAVGKNACEAAKTTFSEKAEVAKAAPAPAVAPVVPAK